MSENLQMGKRHCLSCGEQLQGAYCQHCGEKAINPHHDYSIWHFIEHTIDDFTHFDLKILTSFKHLFFKPGQLTQNFIEGRRVKFMRPVQIFIICSLLFFLFMPKSGSFYAYYEELRDGYKTQGFSLDNPFKYNINAKLKTLAVEKTGITASDSIINHTANEIYAKAHEKAAVMSKTYLFLLVPIWGLIIYALFYRQNKFFVPHLIFSIHIISFFLLLDLIFLVTLFDVFKVHVVENHKHLLPFFIIIGVYIIIATKRVYQQNLQMSILKGLLIYFALLFLIILYRPFITIWALTSI